MYLICKKSGNFFTSGQKYFVLDFIEDGYLVSDDDNAPHYLSEKFAEENFEKCEP